MSTREITKTEPLRKLEMAVAVFLAILLVGFIVLSLNYPARAQLFPLVVAVPALLCMLLIISANFFDRAERLLEAFNAALFETDAEMFEQETTDVNVDAMKRSLGWLIGALVGFYLFGFVLMTLVFVYAYLYIEGDHSRRRSGTIAVLTTAIMYGLFVAVFGVRLNGGAVFVFFFDLLGIPVF
jgi:hypothetical protein